jgi:hypothetical protein
MKKENWQQLYDDVADNQDFNMIDFLHPCGTAACLLGHVATLMIPSTESQDEEELLKKREKLIRTGDQEMADWLGITLNQLPEFYVGSWAGKGISCITKEDALYWLNECLEKGEVTRI